MEFPLHPFKKRLQLDAQLPSKALDSLLERQVRRSCCASEASYRLQPLVSTREIRGCLKSKNRAVAVQDGVISMGCASSKRQVPRLALASD